MKNKTVYLKDYKVSSYLVDKIDLTFVINNDYTIVTSKVCYFKNKDSKDKNYLELNGHNLELITIILDGKNLNLNSFEIKDDILKIFSLSEKFTLEIKTKIYPKLNTSLEGLYSSNNILCTQCESQGFRNITYYLDRPDIMSKYSTKIIANKKDYPVLLSNGNLLDSGDLEDGNHFVLWTDPFKKPSYLFALVAGKLEFIEDSFLTMSGKEVILKIFTEKHNIDKCSFAMKSLKKAMKWDEDKFGLEYDLDLFMIVAVDDFNSGAMENKGLNIFNSSLIFASPESSTDKDFIYIERVVGHEYFHNWTGNRVTCRDWFQLSLKEGLTVFRDSEFTADMNSRASKRIDDVKYLKAYQFREDSSAISHSIRPQSFQEISNFYTVTVYEKGSEVVRMYNTILGEKGFRKGMDLYFQRHDGEAVTTEDFLSAMSSANNIDLSQFQSWYDQAGTPIVNVVSEYNKVKHTYSLSFIQSCNNSKNPFIIPIKFGLLDSSGNDLDIGNNLILLKNFKETFVFKGIYVEPIVSLLRDFSAPIKLNYNYSFQDYSFLISNDNDYYNRFDAIQKFSMEILLNIISTGVFKIDNLFKKAFKSILLDNKIDNSFKADAITLSSETLIADNIGTSVDYKKIFDAREFFIKTLAEDFKIEFTNIYNSLNIQKEYKIDTKDMADRKLLSICLKYISVIKGPIIAHNLYYSSNNMTNTFSAMSVLSNFKSKETNQIMNHFYEKWKSYPNVIDKWFFIQALSNNSDTLDVIKKLSRHSLFDINNPNKVRALLNSFSTLNPLIFNTKDSYIFIVDKILELDKINPAISSRLLKTIINWKILENNLGQILREQLLRISKTPNLSLGVYEIITKGL